MARAWALLGLIVAGVAAAEDPVPPPPALAAKSYYLVDAASGTVLAENAGRERLEPASLTKLMTAYAVFKELESGRIALDDMVEVSEKAWRASGSRMFIEVATEVSVQDLLRGMIVQSGNDASIALAEHVSGSVPAFVELMNKYALGLGMAETKYRNPTGLPAVEHLSSAHDSAILARAIIREFPEYYSWYSEREYTYNHITQHNRNALLWRDASVDGLKTGYTEAAGYCLVSSAERSGMRLIAVVMGMSSARGRTEASEALLDYGFGHFETHKLYTRGEQIARTRVWKGTPSSVALGLPDDLYVTIPRGSYPELAATMELEKVLVAPVGVAVPVGEVQVSFDGQNLAILPLVALHEVPTAGLWTRVTDEVRLWLAWEHLQP
jgi:D-alanyl-D-alanine carboxypeptidase (penicillin-binding protein 5/6)